MPTVERLRERGTKRGQRVLATLADEFREKRLAVGLSQREVAEAAGLSRPTVTRIEAAALKHLSIRDASQVAAVLGLELSVRAFPGPEPLRDAAHAARLARVLAHVSAPLTYRTEVPLPQHPDRPMEQRAWDALVSGSDRRTAIEMEMRLRDSQALERRYEIKRRDDPVDNFVLLVADTHGNRRLLSDMPTLFPELRRMTFRELTMLLGAGLHPPSAMALV